MNLWVIWPVALGAAVIFGAVKYWRLRRGVIRQGTGPTPPAPPETNSDGG